MPINLTHVEASFLAFEKVERYGHGFAANGVVLPLLSPVCTARQKELCLTISSLLELLRQITACLCLCHGFGCSHHSNHVLVAFLLSLDMCAQICKHGATKSVPMVIRKLSKRCRRGRVNLICGFGTTGKASLTWKRSSSALLSRDLLASGQPGLLRRTTMN
jgi:hypothetical protein